MVDTEDRHFMNETTWAVTSALAPFVFAHACPSALYACLVMLTTVRHPRPAHAPRALIYLPVAVLGLYLGSYFAEVVFYNPEFWRARHAQSFQFETTQGLSAIFGLATYSISLRSTHIFLKARWPRFFKDKEIGSTMPNEVAVVLFALLFLTLCQLAVAISCFTKSPWMVGLASGASGGALTDLTGSRGSSLLMYTLGAEAAALAVIYTCLALWLRSADPRAKWISICLTAMVIIAFLVPVGMSASVATAVLPLKLASLMLPFLLWSACRQLISARSRAYFATVSDD